MPEWGVSAGALDDEKNLTVEKHIYIDDKPDFYDFVDGAREQFMANILAEMATHLDEKSWQSMLAKARAQYGDGFADEVARLIAQAQK